MLLAALSARKVFTVKREQPLQTDMGLGVRPTLDCIGISNWSDLYWLDLYKMGLFLLSLFVFLHVL